MFWERFSELCNANGISANAVCAQLGFSTAAATHWKNGTMPKGDVLVKIADFFSVSVDYLLGRVVSDNSTFKKSHLCMVLNELLSNETDYTDFARAVGVDVFIVFTWLRGISITCYDKLPEISEYFNVSIDFLLGRTPVRNIPTGDEIKSYYDLDDTDRAEIRGEIKQMLKSDKYKMSDRIAFPESVDDSRSYTNIDFDDDIERIAAFGGVEENNDEPLTT